MNTATEHIDENNAAYTLRLPGTLKDEFQKACRKRGRDMAGVLRLWVKVAIARCAAGQDVEPPDDWGEAICSPTFTRPKPGDEKAGKKLLANLLREELKRLEEP